MNVYYFENFERTKMDSSQSIGTIYNWWSHTVSGTGSYNQHQLHRLDVQITLDQHFIDGGISFNDYQKNHATFSIILPQSELTVTSHPSRTNCICELKSQTGHDKIRLYRLLTENEIHLNKLPFSVKTQRKKRLTTDGISDINNISPQPISLHPDTYLDPNTLWPISLDVEQGNLSVQDLPFLSHSVTDKPYGQKWTNPRVQSILHPLLLAGVKLSTLGASHILGDAIASATSLAADKLWTEIKPVHDKFMDNFSTFQDYLNSENGLFNYEVGTDKVTVSIVDRTSPVISNGKQLYEDQLSDLRSQTRTIEYFAEQILPKLPHFLIQRLLNNSQIQENIVPKSKIHYKVERRNSFLQIKFFFTVYAKETQGLYRFHFHGFQKYV